MITYKYKAKKSNAQSVEGEIKAASQDEAIELINQLGLLPVSVIAQSSDDHIELVNSRARIKSKERYIFTKQLANLIKSGVSILRSINIIAEQTQNKLFKKILLNISERINSGSTFSGSLEQYPKIFSSLYITMVHAGEESGSLQEMLESLASFQSAQEDIRSKVRLAVSYPCLMLFVGIGTVYFMLSFVMPRMSSLFTTIGDDLPLPTKILLSSSDMVSQWGLWFFIGFAMFIFLMMRWAKSHIGNRMISSFVLNLPLIGDILLKSELLRFCRTIVLLSQGGVSLVNALHISIPMLGNEVVKGQLILCREELIAGGSFGEMLKKSNKIPSMMGYLVSVGEESGNLDEVLLELAQTYENETNEKIKIMTTLLEPIMILIIGLMIGFIVFAMLLPIFQLDIMSS